MKLHFWHFSPSSKIDFWPFLKLQKMEFGQKDFFREMDLFDFTSFLAWTFLNFLSELAISVHKKVMTNQENSCHFSPFCRWPAGTSITQ